MYLHIGNDCSLLIKDIIIIINGNKVPAGFPIVRKALIEGQSVRSVILTDTAAFLSTINSTTLQKRAAVDGILQAD